MGRKLYLCRMQENEIKWPDLWRLWWSRRRTIGLCALGGVILGSAVAFAWPKRYTAVVKTVAESRKEGIASELQSLGSLLGVQIDNLRPDEYLAAELYPDIVASTPFLTEWRAEELAGLSGEEAYPILRRWRKNTDVFTDNKSGLTTIRVTARDAQAAAGAADSLTTKLERYLIETRTQKARADLAFAEARFEEAKANYYTAQEAYARFVDANRHLTSESAAVERDRLENEQRLAYNLYSQLANQLEMARIRVQEQTPVLTVIEPSVVPVRHSSPRRKAIVLAGLLLGLAVPMGWLAGKRYWEKN